MNSYFSLKHTLSYVLCLRYKKICSYVSVYYEIFF